MIVGQLALSLVLLVAAGLFLRALNIGSRIDPGFDRTGLSVAAFESQSWGYDSARARRFYEDLSERVAAIPGVTDVAFASFAPLTTRSMNDSVTFANGDRAFTWTTNVGGDYFATLRMPIVAGRPFAESDDERSAPVAVINETLARKLAPDGAALGRTLTFGKRVVTVVGIARDAKYAGFAETTPAMTFFPMRQHWQPHQTMLVRTAVVNAPVTAGLRSAIQSLDPALPVPALVTLERASGIAVITQRIAAIVTGTLGGAGLLLATLGLYGVIAYSVNRRTSEMGVRVALGARPRDVLRLVVREGMSLSLSGVALGLVMSAAASRLIAGFLFDVDPLDVNTFAGMSAMFVFVALLATFLPARRASRADPMAALRSE
jgi:predicted permease